VKDIDVTLKPMGISVRNVRCIRCGAYGHRAKERECPLRDVISEQDTEKASAEDPMTKMKSQFIDNAQKFALKFTEDPIHGGFGDEDDNQKLVESDKEDKSSESEHEITELETEFLSSLSEKEMKLLLKKYKKEEKRSKKKKKKEKSKKKMSSSRSNSPAPPKKSSKSPDHEKRSRKKRSSSRSRKKSKSPIRDSKRRRRSNS